MVLRGFTGRAGLLGGFLSICFVYSSGQSDDTALKDRLQRAEELTSLDDGGLEPWHLKMHVQLYDFHGKPKEQGTIEEWWSGPMSYRIVYSLPSYSDTELRTDEGSFSSNVGGAVPYYLRFLRRQVVHPIPTAGQRINTKLEVSSKKSGAVELELLSLHPALEKNPYPTDYHPTYCFEKGKDVLLLSSDFRTEDARRTKLGKFQGHSVALGVTVLAGERIVADAEVDELKGQSTPYPETKDTAGLVKDAGGDLDVGPVPQSAPVQAGRIIKKVQPIYPPMAKSRGIQGSVVFSVLIGESGTVESLEVIFSPDESLSEAATEAVRQWTYSPYLVGGIAVKVDTLVTVNFSLGHM